MPELNLETVAQFLKRADHLRQHYYSQIRTPDGKIPRNADVAIRELLIGHFGDEWKPLLVSRLGLTSPEEFVEIVEVGLQIISSQESNHISGSVLFLENIPTDQLQTAIQILCHRMDGSPVLVRVYSDPVPRWILIENERYPNVSASEPSRELRFLEYIRGNRLTALGWINWNWPSEILQRPMVTALTRVMDQLRNAVDDCNKTVKEKVGVDMELRIPAIRQRSEEDWIVNVTGKDCRGEQRSKVFSLRWTSYRTPNNFELHEYRRGNVDDVVKFFYECVLPTNAKEIVKIIAILTYGEQIPGVLTHLS